MKHHTLLFVILFFTIWSNSFGQSSPKVAADTTKRMFIHYEVMPTFPGGNKELMNFIGKNIKYPTTEACVEGKVIITFVIEADGSISNAKVVRSLHPDFDKEALRVVNLMPKWMPGKWNGIARRTEFTIPIVFTPNKKDKKACKLK